MAFRLSRLYRRLRYGEPIVVVSGLPRSGTSMAMKMLEAGGMSLAVDGIRKADEDNPKGYFELERVKNLARERDKGWLTPNRGKVIKIISYLLKELPRTNNYKVLFMCRDLEEVIASQNKMLERREEEKHSEDGRMTELFENDLWRSRYLIRHASHLEALEVNYREVIEAPRLQAEKIRAFLGRPLDVEKMAAVVDERLYRNRTESSQQP